MTSVERPDQIFGKAEPLDVNLEEIRGMIPEQFKTNGELDVYKMVAGYHEKTNANNREYRLEKCPRQYLQYNLMGAMELYESPSEHALRWQREVRQLVNDWQALPVRTKRGDRLASDVTGMLNRRIASGSTGRSDRGLVSRMRSTLTMGTIANELIAVAAELSNGDSAAVMTASGTHCVFFLANPEGSFVGICEMSEKLPTFIDGVPDYLYYAVISAIGWRGMNSIPHHLECIIRKAMSFGGFSNDAFIQLEIVNHPEYVTKMPEHYALGCITMEEVTRGVESPNTRPILIK